MSKMFKTGDDDETNIEDRRIDSKYIYINSTGPIKDHVFIKFIQPLNGTLSLAYLDRSFINSLSFIHAGEFEVWNGFYWINNRQFSNGMSFKLPPNARYSVEPENESINIEFYSDINFRMSLLRSKEEILKDLEHDWLGTPYR